jgi:hypothetical protein
MYAGYSLAPATVRPGLPHRGGISDKSLESLRIGAVSAHEARKPVSSI